MRLAAKRDKGESEIVDALRAIGATVTPISQPGAPDLLVGIAGHNILLETKSVGEILTPHQKRWHAEWRGTAHVVYSVAEALMVAKHYMAKK